jgi:hypothetical protein
MYLLLLLLLSTCIEVISVFNTKKNEYSKDNNKFRNKNGGCTDVFAKIMLVD